MHSVLKESEGTMAPNPFLLMFSGLLYTCAVPDVCSNGVTMYVSKLGDNTTGSSWEHAFHTIQAALDAIPDDKGGHRIIVRPDTYMEAMLKPAHAGAKGAYNILEADIRGSEGSGSQGYAVVDSSDVKLGCKSIDWWSPFHCTAEMAATNWDRWVLRGFYCTGSEAGMGWDMSGDLGAEFTVVVEDCVGVGRAFGGIVAGFTSRLDEPVVYRRCQLWSLDWWGDASGMYVREERKEPAPAAGVILEDCTLVGPQCSLKAGNPGYSGYSRVRLKNCRLITLNFSQPHGTPTVGVIQSVVEGKYLHVDLEDCTVMGYKVFGVRENPDTVSEITYTTNGSVRAYVQFQQEVPSGFLRLGHWPTETFAALAPPPLPGFKPNLVKEGPVLKGVCEVTPLFWRGKLCLLKNVRPVAEGKTSDFYLTIVDAETNEEYARFAEGYSLASALVWDDVLYVYASRYEAGNPWNDVTVFWSSDGRTWDKKIAVNQENEHLFNSSVCRGADTFVMVYETNDSKYVPFSLKFALSKDLKHWEKVDGVVFAPERYAACPCIRYLDGWYYLLYTEHRTPRWFFETWLARSRDLRTWELAPRNPVLTPDLQDEGINTSDPDIIEVNGKTLLYYAVGDQMTWMNIKRAVFDGDMKTFFNLFF